jgi:DNA-binding IclR family transcriptional regulator
MSDTLVLSVKKALDILDILVFDDIDKNGIGLFSIAKKIKQKPNTVHNILKTLIFCGYAIQNEKSHYLAGPKCDDMINAGKLSKSSVLIRELKQLLYKLSEKINESIILTALVNGNRVPLVSIEGKNVIKVDMSADQVAHIYERPTGRILVSYSDEKSFQIIKDKWGFPGEKWGNAFDDKKFNQLRKEIREKEYIIKKEYNNSLVSIAVPIKDPTAKYVYSLGSYAPLFRCDTDKQNKILDELKIMANMLRNLL